MNADQGQVYVCPMHADVRQANPGRCPRCRMDLLPQGTKFGMLRHMSKSAVMIILMFAIMAAIMIVVMM